MPRDLPHPDNLHLRAAHGWVELGNAKEAQAELERISGPLRSHSDVLELQWQVSAQLKDWERCVQVADEAIRAEPTRPEPWIHRSFALHELKRTQEAFEKLLPAADKFLEVWTVPYNLACYCSQLGQFTEAKVWFTKATAIDSDAARRAGDQDPDLKPLWENLGGKLWKD